MNGRALPAQHGYPARIIVPGLYGYVSAVKWLARIELTRFADQVGYWVPRGWAQEAPIKLSSRIDVPLDSSLPTGGSIPAGRRHIAGVAWSGDEGIGRVQVKVDGGAWTDAELGPQLAATTWRQWWLAWEATPGLHTITVRAEDAAGRPQSTRMVPSMPDGAEGLHQIVVDVQAAAGANG